MATEGHPIHRPTQEFQQSESAGSYTPLDPDEELKQILKKRTEIYEHEGTEESISKERAALSEQIRNLEQNTLEQRLAIAKLINHAYELINQNPELTEAEFMQIVTQHAPQARLPKWMINTFQRKYYEYQSHHKSVHRYVETYRTPEALFAVCFGSSPVGQIRWVIGPMTIDFQCFSEKDFNTISNTGKSQRAYESEEVVGYAVNQCKIPDLNGCIIAENAVNNAKGGEKQGIITIEIHPGQKLKLKGETQTYRIRDNDQRLIVQVEYQSQDRDQPPRITSVSVTNYDNKEVLLRYQREDGAPESQAWIDQSQKIHQDTQVDIPLSSDGLVSCSVDWQTDEVNITNHSPNEWNCVHDIIYANPTPTEIRDINYSQKLQAHENLHQWNRLFSPAEKPESITVIIDGYPNIESPNDPRIFKLYCDLFIRQRKVLLVDNFGRDEILAQYHQGCSPANINNILKLDSYSIIKEPSFISQKSTIQAEIDYLLGVYWQNNPNAPDVSKLDPSIKAKAIQYAFQTDYHAQITNWTDAITQLEAAGLPRETILAILYQEPASHWEVTAKRYTKYSKQEKSIQGNP